MFRLIKQRRKTPNLIYVEKKYAFHLKHALIAVNKQAVVSQCSLNLFLILRKGDGTGWNEMIFGYDTKDDDNGNDDMLAAAAKNILALSTTFAPQTADVNNNFKCISDNPIIIMEIVSKFPNSFVYFHIFVVIEFCYYFPRLPLSRAIKVNL